MEKPTFKGEAKIGETIRLPYGDINIKVNSYGSYEIQFSIAETHIVKHYVMKQRKNNTLEHLTIIIKPNDD